MENYLYFRTQATLADDDAKEDSGLFPVSSFLGMNPTSDTALTLFFKPRRLVDSTSNLALNQDTDNAVAASTLQQLSSKTESDSVVIVVTANKHKEVMQAICNTMTQSQAGFINVADDISGAPSYLHPNITACGTITIETGATVGAPTLVAVSTG